MRITTTPNDYSKTKADVYVIGAFENEQPLKEIDEILNKEISTSFADKQFTAEFGQMKAVTTLGKLPSKVFLIVGLGKKKDLTIEILRRASATAIKYALSTKSRTLATSLHQLDISMANERVKAVIEGSMLASYKFTQFKKEENNVEFEELILIKPAVDAEIINNSVAVCESVIHVRNMVNMPPNVLTPQKLADEALKLQKLGVSVKVFEKPELEKMGFNALLAVASGSALPPKFVVMEYGKGKETYAFVGKGITFDSGGLDIKPVKYMEDMKQDMAGAATVLGLMEAIARTKMQVHVVCAFPTCENMPSGSSFRPGDVITGFNKKNIEMMNTDAEGRMILSDALSYVEKEYKPTVMIDLATLTGACVVALGYWATGMFSKDDKLCEELVQAGNETYERVWRLPLWDEYKDNIKSDIADVRSVGKGYDAGSIEAAWFLAHFVDKVRWAHLDIAGTGWFDSDKFYCTKGGTGNGVRLLLRWLEKKAKRLAD